MNKKILITFGLAILFQIVFTGTSQAAIFKCVNDEGGVFYLDKPCPVDHDEESLKHVKDPKNSENRTISVTPQKPIEKNSTINKGIQVKRWALKGDTDSSKQSASSSVSKKDGRSSKGTNDIGALTTKGTVDDSKPEDFSESSLPVDFDASNIDEMSGELVERLSQLKAF